MTSDKRCVICKHYDLADENESCELGYVYDQNGNPIKVLLCRTHSVELFKMGQNSFFLRHYKILFNVIGSNEAKFLQLLENVIRSNLDGVY